MILSTVSGEYCGRKSAAFASAAKQIQFSPVFPRVTLCTLW